MTQLLIEIEADGKYCGECGNKNIRAHYCFFVLNTGLVSTLKKAYIKYNRKNRKYIRCPACLDAEKRAKEIEINAIKNILRKIKESMKVLGQVPPLVEPEDVLKAIKDFEVK